MIISNSFTIKIVTETDITQKKELMPRDRKIEEQRGGKSTRFDIIIYEPPRSIS